MKLALFGATGTVGQVLLPAALERGHRVRVLARTPSKITTTGLALQVREGNARDPDAVAATVAGCDAVLSTLGGLSDPGSVEVGTAAITAAMHEAGIHRLVVVKGFHLEFPGDPHNLGRRVIVPLLWLASRDLVPHTRAMAAAIQGSQLDWTVVRAPRIVPGPRTTDYRTGQLPLGPWNSVSATDVADVVLRCLDDPITTHTAPMMTRGTTRTRASRRGTARTPTSHRAGPDPQGRRG